MQSLASVWKSTQRHCRQTK